MSKLHAVLSPSSAHRWSSCTASVGASALNTEPDEGSDAARLGTCGHQILEDLLRDETLDPQSFLGREFIFWSHPESESFGDGWYSQLFDGNGEPFDPCLEVLHTVTVDQALIDAVVTARNFVLEQAELNGATIIPEMRVPIGHITGEDGAKGTSDVTFIAGDTVWQLDLKLGRRRVDAYEIVTPAGEDLITGAPIDEVVRPNLQLALYALGTIEELRGQHEFKFVRLVILQPFLNHVSEWSGTVEELMQVGAWLSEKAEETRTHPVFKPDADNCLYCRASGRCEAQTALVMTTALEGFDDVETATVRKPSDLTLGDHYALIPLINVWAKAVTERVGEALRAGEPVVRSDGLFYKLVEGKMGARTWTSEEEAEEALRRMRLKSEQMYNRSVISPTQAEKLAKAKKPKKGEEATPPVLGPTQWNRLQSLITQERGQPSVALSTDPRPAIAPATDGFEDVPPADNSDLF